MMESIGEIIKYGDLLYMMVWRDIRIKYKQSVIGIMWAVFMPMVIVGTGILVRYGFALASHAPVDFNDLAAVSVKAVPWAFFVSTIRFSTGSLVGNPNLVTKIYFPKIIFPISSMFSQMFDLAIASGLLAVVLAFMRIGLSVHLLWVPILLALLVLCATGMGILLSAANLFYRDVKYLVEVVVTFAIFFTPVFYDVSMFGKWAYIFLLNPLAPILEGIAACVVHHRMPQIEWILYSAAASLAIFACAFAFFTKLEPLFAERI
ncbi:MAG: ABC transporter permease [Syntrophorhabdales bacterium]|jgi:lipopolysaccharide transport system permease protein